MIGHANGLVRIAASKHRREHHAAQILKGLGAAAVGISLSGKKYSAWAAGEEPKLNGRESLGELGRLKPGRAPRLTPHTLRRL